MDAEQRVAVGPGMDDREPGAGGERTELVDRVLVRIFGVNEFASGECEAAAGDGNRLFGEAFQIQLHAAGFGIVERDMREAIDIDIAVQLAIYPDQQIEIERGIDAGAVVIGGVENFRPLFQIGADQHFAFPSEQLDAMPEEAYDTLRLEIADCRTREKPDPLA